MSQISEQYMQHALQLASQGRYTVSPNPMVGCVLVKDDQIVSEGYHQKAGGAHAEVLALTAAGTQAKGATAYVTLEPCCHHGRTPPCTDALVKAGVSKVIVACLDPNPLVAGKGIEQLRAAGITVEIGLLKEAATELNKIFFHYIQTKRPYVISKWAMSLDGKTITAPNDSKKISGTEAQMQVHQLRQQVDAILIGAETARSDDPQLTARFNLHTDKQPVRVIVSTSGHLPTTLRIFEKRLPGVTILAVTDKHAAETWKKRGVDVLLFSTLTDLLNQLAQREIASVLVEGGEQIRQQFFAENLVNEIEVYIAPIIISGLERKKKIENINIKLIGSDIRVNGKF